MDFQQFAYNRNDNHPMMPQVKMEPGIKLEPVDNMPPQVDAMLQQLDRMASPQLAPSPGPSPQMALSHMDGMTPQQQQQYTQQMQQQQQYQQQQYQMLPQQGMAMPPHTMGMPMGPTGQPMGMMNGMQPGGAQVPMLPAPVEEPKKKGRKKKLKQEKLTDDMKQKKPRKKFDRFHGMPESEVVKRTLPDLLVHNLDIVIVGINPGLMAAYKGHHYAGPGNHFWKCLYLSGFIPEPMTCMDDERLKDFGIGFTSIVERTTRGSADLTRKEIKEGGKRLTEKMQIYKPLIACFNGKGIYEIFSGKKDFQIGRQPETIPDTDTIIYVMPSSSARCSQFPRAQDKVKFYLTLKELRNDLKGIPNEPRPPEYREPPEGPMPVLTKPSNKKIKKEAQQQVKQEGGVQQQQPPQMQMPSVQQQQQMQQQQMQQQQQGVQVKQEPGLYNANQQGSPQQVGSPQQQIQQQQIQQQQQLQQQQGVQIKQEPGLYNTSQQGCPQQQMQNQQQISNQQQQQMQQQMQQQQPQPQQGVQIKQEPGMYNSSQQGCPQQQIPNQQQQQHMQQQQMSQQQQQMGMQQLSHQQQLQMQQQRMQQQQMPYQQQQPGMHIKQEPGLYNANQVCPQSQSPGLRPGVSPPAQGMQQPPQGMPYYPPRGQQPHLNIKQEPLDRYSQYPPNNSYPPQYAHPMPNIKQEPGMMGMHGHYIDRVPNITSAGPAGVTNVQSMVNRGSPGMGHPQMGLNAGSPAGMGQPGAPNQGSPSQNSAGEISSFGEAFQLLNSTEGFPPT